MWRYGFSQDVLAYLVELISGVSFNVFLEENPSKSLSMDDTGYCVSVEQSGRLAAVYAPAPDGTLALIESPMGCELFSQDRVPLGSTGLVSTIPDFLRFAQMMLNGGTFDGTRILSPKSISFMTKNHLSRELLPSFNIAGFGGALFTQGCGYGFGVRVLINVAQSGALGSEGEYGWAGVFNTDYWVDPRESLVGLIWTQLSLPNHRIPD